jgi:hypothetical protein
LYPFRTLNADIERKGEETGKLKGKKQKGRKKWNGKINTEMRREKRSSQKFEPLGICHIALCTRLLEHLKAAIFWDIAPRNPYVN